jgi:hypothetical protein
VAAWNFYFRNVSAFVREYGIMPMRIADTGYEGVAKEIFIQKCSAVHDMVTRKGAAKAAARAGQEDPAVTIEGSENG